MLKTLFQIDIRYLKLLKFLWVGIFFGYFVPSGIGIYIYRVIAVVKDAGGYGKNIMVMIFENAAALFSMLVLFVITYPFVIDKLVENHWFGDYLVLTWISCIVLIVGAVLAAGAYRMSRFQRLVDHVNRIAGHSANRVAKKIGHETEYEIDIHVLIEPLFRKGNIIVIIAISIAMLIVASFGSNLIFRSVGVKLDVAINMFATSLSMILLMLPISFGAIGVREGVYILLFGLFGVAAETALAVSFLEFFGTLFINSLGGVVYVLGRLTPEETARKI